MPTPLPSVPIPGRPGLGPDTRCVTIRHTRRCVVVPRTSWLLVFPPPQLRTVILPPVQLGPLWRWSGLQPMPTRTTRPLPVQLGTLGDDLASTLDTRVRLWAFMDDWDPFPGRSASWFNLSNCSSQICWGLGPNNSLFRESLPWSYNWFRICLSLTHAGGYIPQTYLCSLILDHKFLIYLDLDL